jgi:hypothetical protein
MDHPPFLHALESWCKERETYPSRLEVRMANTLRARMKIHVEAQPQKNLLPTTGDTQLLPSCYVLIDEKLTESTADHLTTALRAIQKHQGLVFRQGLCYMTLLYLVFCDLARTQADKLSILFTNGDAQRAEHEQEALSPLWSLDDVLEFWERLDGHLDQGFLPPPDSQGGRWSYNTIPPLWFPDAISAVGYPTSELLYHGQDMALQPPTGSDIVLTSQENWKERLLALLQGIDQPGVLVQIFISTAVAESQAEGSAKTQAIDIDPGALRVGPDGRSVNLRGEEFSLTPTQAQVFDILYKAYQNGTPDVSEAYIIDHLGYEKGKVKDVFKRHDNWQKLIVKGARKDTFRLNIGM